VAFSREVIRELLAGTAAQRLALKEAYAGLPGTRCRRRTHCCSLLPEMSLLEGLAATQLLLEMKPDQRLQVSNRLLRYFFLNPVEILSCPFLEGHDCLVYQERFFGCRAYGLWSREYYQKQAKRSRQAKLLGQQQWQRLGVALPQEVVDFHLNYCPHVELEGDVAVNDEVLVQTSDVIESISGQLVPWHDQFRQEYFSDLSFLLASIALGLQQAIQLKFEIVRDILSTGNHEKVEDIVDKLDDFFEDLKNR
jgi:hypothetical protein